MGVWKKIVLACLLGDAICKWVGFFVLAEDLNNASQFIAMSYCLKLMTYILFFLNKLECLYECVGMSNCLIASVF